MINESHHPPDAVAVLASGGLDSCVLMHQLARVTARVFPVYVRCGLTWETAELRSLRRFLGELNAPALQPLVVLDSSVKSLYGGHWSVTGVGIPPADSDDLEVELPGRNLILTSQAGLWCQLNLVDVLHIATLQSSPFVDARPAFFAHVQQLLAQTGRPVQIRCPFAGHSKIEVLRFGAELPLQFTFSCLQPQADLHCGECNKCHERQQVFLQAGIDDPTEYHFAAPLIASQGQLDEEER